MENPKDSEEESQEGRFDVPEANEKAKGQSKGKEKRKGKGKVKKVEVLLNWWKDASPHAKK